MRLPTKPRQLPTSTPTLPSFFESCMQVAITSIWTGCAATISSSRITFAGLKKCVPMTMCGREVADAISSMFSVEVLVARIASVLQTRPARRRSLSSAPSFEHSFDHDVGVVRIRRSSRCRRDQCQASVASLSCVKRPLASPSWRSSFRMVASPRSSAACSDSFSRHWDAGVRQHHRDSAAHRARAD